MYWYALIAVLLFTTSLARAADTYVYFGTRHSGPTKGFSLSHFDTQTGALTVPKFDAQADAPAFFIIAPNGKFLYAANAVPAFGGQPNMGAVSAYALDPKTGHLTLINQKPSAGGDPSYISLDKTGRFALLANYLGNHIVGEGGTIAVIAIQPDGSFGAQTAFVQHKGASIHPTRQQQAYAHSIIVDPSNRFVLACDFGLDKVMVYKFNEKDGTLTPNDTPFAAVKPGSGPRHHVFSPSGKILYVVQELTSTVAAFHWDADKGTLAPFQEITTLPADFTGTSTCAEIKITPDGKFLYATNRGHDSIAQFTVAADGKLAPLGTIPSAGKTPRNFDFDPTGNWMIVTNHGSDNAVVFKIDRTTGKLTQQGDPVAVPYPFCPRFLPVPAP